MATNPLPRESSEPRRWKIFRGQYEMNVHGPAFEDGEEVMPVDEHEELRKAAELALEILGASHIMEEGPNATWRGEGEAAYYDEDLRDAPNCAVCLAQEALRAALGQQQQRGSGA